MNGTVSALLTGSGVTAFGAVVVAWIARSSNKLTFLAATRAEDNNERKAITDLAKEMRAELRAESAEREKRIMDLEKELHDVKKENLRLIAIEAAGAASVAELKRRDERYAGKGVGYFQVAAYLDNHPEVLIEIAKL